jgi:hypothetical protein
MDDHLDASQKRAEETRSPSFMRLFGQMVMLPFTVFVQGMELFIKTIQGMQRATDEGMSVMVGGTTQAPDTAPGDQSDLTSSKTGSVTGGVTKDDAATNLKERINMSDKDLSNKDMLKLVRYKILFIKRDYETAFPEVEEIVSDPMEDCDYTAWKVAEFIQRLARKETRIPMKWGTKYPKIDHKPPYREGNFLLGFPEEDKKYLRVYFEVLARYEREAFKYQERQVEVLEEIRDNLRRA